MPKREFLMKAYNMSCPRGQRTHVGGWMLSEKFDGIRCFWDGGISRGKAKAEVPWANTAKDGRYKDAQVCTGLWSYYGNVIHAPDWWLDDLPKHFLDGELWVGRGEGERQRLTRIVKRLVPNIYEWRDVQYLVFDCPPLERVFETGESTNTNFKKKFNLTLCLDYCKRNGLDRLTWVCGPNAVFTSRYQRLLHEDVGNVTEIIKQTHLPNSNEEARETTDTELAAVLAKNGEGVVIRSPNGQWEPKRAYSMFKIKDIKTAEATVIGYTSGRETDKGSKLLGKMGALVCRMADGKVFQLSGFTDAERALTPAAEAWATNHPDQRISEDLGDANPNFPIGSTVTYKYREHTADGYPSEARYMRQRVVGLE